MGEWMDCHGSQRHVSRYSVLTLANGMLWCLMVGALVVERLGGGEVPRRKSKQVQPAWTEVFRIGPIVAHMGMGLDGRSEADHSDPTYRPLKEWK